MTFFEYLESHYVTKNIQCQTKYTPWVKAETMALLRLIGIQRWFYLHLATALHLGAYIAFKCHLVKPPRPAKEMIKEYEVDALAKAKAKQAAQTPSETPKPLTIA